MRNFTHETLPGRVVFGQRTLGQILAEVDQLGLKRPLLIATPGRRALAERVDGLLDGRSVGIFDRAVMHAPEHCVRKADSLAVETQADGLICCGGGSPIGIAKALAHEKGLPIIAIATTYSGSEMTAQWSLTRNGLKEGGRNPRVKPQVVIYDPLLTLDLPVSISVTSGFNAMAHCVEGLYAEGVAPGVMTLAQLGISEMAAALRVIVTDPRNPEARARALHGGHLGGAVMAESGIALHHKLCHVLGGTFGLSHAETHTIVLPHATRYNADAAPDAMRAIATALGTDDAAGGLFDLALECGAPTRLRDIGMAEADLDRAARIAVGKPYPNPRTLDFDAVRGLLGAAFEGTRP